jgi:phosphatidylglycerophosphatase A
VLWLTPTTWVWQASAVAVFRVFDIVKPWPIRQADARFKSGFGVMFDDVLAAGYTLLLLALVERVWT